MLEELKEKVCAANVELHARGIVVYTWGNVSAVDRASGLVVIKPSGVPYDRMQPEDMVVVALDTGEVTEGPWRPSSDTPTHLELYRRFARIGGICHTHSTHAVAFAQAGRAIPPLGTTHADYFYGAVPCTRALTQPETETDYEANTGKVIVELFESYGLDSVAVPGVLVRSHGPFTWGKDADQAVYHAVVLEKVAEMAWKTLLLDHDSAMAQYTLDKHYLRKHGAEAYYGQRQKHD